MRGISSFTTKYKLSLSESLMTNSGSIEHQTLIVSVVNNFDEHTMRACYNVLHYWLEKYFKYLPNFSKINKNLSKN